ncbi:MAG: hypothetical protein WAN11_19680 [Syntrophobacteraceae bacterium]
MKLIFTMSLLVVLLFTSAFSYAAGMQSPAVADQLAKVSCPNPEKITETSTITFFGGPHLGWQKVPVEREKVICRVFE